MLTIYSVLTDFYWTSLKYVSLAYASLKISAVIRRVVLLRIDTQSVEW